jgi:hypothetical protein
MPLDFTTVIAEPERFCLFNTGSLTAPEVWEILKDRLTPDALLGVKKVAAIRQPNGNTRMDLWIEKRVAADIPKALYLKASQRRRGVKVNNHVPLCELGSLWIPNAATKKWRIDIWRPWRDRVLEEEPIKHPHLSARMTRIATFNVNGFIGKRPEILDLLAAGRIGILAMQETLLDRNRYALTVPGYKVYERPKKLGFRGQALLVSLEFPSYEVSSNIERMRRVRHGSTGVGALQDSRS